MSNTTLAMSKFGVFTNKGYLDILTNEFTEQPTMNCLTSKQDAESKAITFDGKVVSIDVVLTSKEI